MSAFLALLNNYKVLEIIVPVIIIFCILCLATTLMTKNFEDCGDSFVIEQLFRSLILAGLFFIISSLGYYYYQNVLTDNHFIVLFSIALLTSLIILSPIIKSDYGGCISDRFPLSLLWSLLIVTIFYALFIEKDKALLNMWKPLIAWIISVLAIVGSTSLLNKCSPKKKIHLLVF